MQKGSFQAYFFTKTYNPTESPQWLVFLFSRLMFASMYITLWAETFAFFANLGHFRESLCHWKFKSSETQKFFPTKLWIILKSAKVISLKKKRFTETTPEILLIEIRLSRYSLSFSITHHLLVIRGGSREWWTHSLFSWMLTFAKVFHAKMKIIFPSRKFFPRNLSQKLSFAKVFVKNYAGFFALRKFLLLKYPKSHPFWSLEQVRWTKRTKKKWSHFTPAVNNKFGYWMSDNKR